MSNLQLTEVPTAKTGMLIRKPVTDVFEAIVNPDITTKFWFTKSSGRLELGKCVKWEWEMYNASTQVTAKAIEPNKRVLIEWEGYSGQTNVEWKFTPLENGTFISVTEFGWTGNGDDLVKYVADSTQGFTLMLAGLKALLEHNISSISRETAIRKAAKSIKARSYFVSVSTTKTLTFLSLSVSSLSPRYRLQ